MQVYKLFFQVLRKQKGQIIMYLVIFLSVTLAATSQGEKTLLYKNKKRQENQHFHQLRINLL